MALTCNWPGPAPFLNYTDLDLERGLQIKGAMLGSSLGVAFVVGRCAACVACCVHPLYGFRSASLPQSSCDGARTFLFCTGKRFKMQLPQPIV